MFANNKVSEKVPNFFFCYLSSEIFLQAFFTILWRVTTKYFSSIVSKNGSDCEYCLANAVSNISSCTPKQEGRVLNTGCYLRYSTEKFYYNSTQPVRNSNQGEFGSNEFFHFLFYLSFIESNGILMFTVLFSRL